MVSTALCTEIKFYCKIYLCEETAVSMKFLEFKVYGMLILYLFFLILFVRKSGISILKLCFLLPYNSKLLH